MSYQMLIKGLRSYGSTLISSSITWSLGDPEEVRESREEPPGDGGFEGFILITVELTLEQFDDDSEVWLILLTEFGLGEMLCVEFAAFWGLITEFINCWEPLNKWWKFGFDFSLRNVWLQLNASTSWFISRRSVIQRVILRNSSNLSFRVKWGWG